VDGCTPLIWAVHNNHYENAKMLVDAGASLTPVDLKGRTAKEHALSQKLRSLFVAPGEVVDSGLKDLEPNEFTSQVIDAETDVVLYMYSPSCGHCRDFAPHFDELAAALRPTSLAFYKMDVTKGEPAKDYQVSSLPTIFLSKKKETTGKKPDPMVFQGKRTVKGITKWLQTRVTNRFMFTSGGKEQDVPDHIDLNEAGISDTEPVEKSSSSDGSEGSCSASAAKEGKCDDKPSTDEALDSDPPSNPHEEL